MSHSYLAVSNKQADPRYPYAPLGWSEEQAQAFARQEGIEFGPDQKALIGSIQEFVHRNDDKPLNTRRLSDALDETFHHRGGMRYLHEIFPDGPISQGFRLAGLDAPAVATDKSFGSVQ